MSLRRASRDDLRDLPLEVAPRLLGSELRVTVDGAQVRLRLTEVEAYHGQGTGDVVDPGSHARMGRTARNATMWGEPGRLYVYLSHGIHSCVNVVCGPEGVAGGVLLRGAEVVGGAAVATARSGRTGRDLARGPGRLGQVAGLRHPVHDGIDAVTGEKLAEATAELWLAEGSTRIPTADGVATGPDLAAGPGIATGPRVGVAGVAGTDAYPWRFWIPGDPTVSAFRWGRGAASVVLN